MREGLNPIADRIAHLTHRDRIPHQIVEPIEAGDLSVALKEANAWYAKSRQPTPAIVYATLLLFRDLDREARGILKQTRSEFENASLDLLAAELELLSGNVEQAMTLLRDTMSQDLNAGQCTFVAELLLDTGDPEGFETWIDRALEKGGTVHAAREAYKLRANDPEAAAKALLVAGRIAPDDRELWLSIARAWVDANRADEAVRAFERAQIIGVDFYAIGSEYAEALLDAGELVTCRKVLARLREYDDDDVQLMRLMGTVLFELGDFERARVLWKQVVQLEREPDDVSMHAECARRLGDISMEVNILADGFKEHPTLAAQYARALIRLGRHAVADDVLSSADPSDLDVRIAVAISSIASQETIDVAGFDEADILELLEVAFVAGATEKFIALRRSADPNFYKPWFDLIDYAFECKTGKTGNFEVPQTFIPIWETETLERLASFLPDRDRFLNILQEYETRMEPLPELKF